MKSKKTHSMKGTVQNMKKTNNVVKESVLKMTTQFDETATFETLTGLLTVCGSQMTSTLYILRTGLSEAIMVTISNSVTYVFDNEEEFQKYLSKKKFVKYNTEKEMYQDFLKMDDETWEQWNEGM